MVGEIFTIPVELGDQAASSGTLSHYVGDAANRLVRGVVDALLDRSGRFNPLLLCGPSGTGKTMLATGLAARWCQPGANCPTGRQPVQVVTGRDFAHSHAEAIETDAVHDLRRRYTRCELLVIDNVDHLSGRSAAQAELTVVLDELLRRGNQFVGTSSRLPVEMEKFSGALVGRLSAGLTVPLRSPGGAARQALFVRLLEQHAVELAPDCEQYVATELSRDDAHELSFSELRGFVLELLGLQNRHGKALGRREVARLLDRRLAVPEPTLAHISSVVCRHFQLTKKELRSGTRQQHIVRARSVAMYLSRQLTDKTFAQVGRHFGGRDHTTVMHACKRAEEWISSDANARLDLEQLIEQCRATTAC